LPQKRPVEAFRPLYIHNLPPSDSITPPSFARAVFEANVGRAIVRRAASDRRFLRF
jgi:hypothetical protein